MPILPLTNAVDIYRYSDEFLKHMPMQKIKLSFTVIIMIDVRITQQQTRWWEIQPTKISQTE